MTLIVVAKSVPSMIHPGLYRPIPEPPPWILEPSLLRALYNKIHMYRAKGKPTRGKMQEYINGTPSFDHWTACQVTSIDLGAFGRAGEVGFDISFGYVHDVAMITYIHDVAMITYSHDYFKVDAKLRVVTGVPVSRRAGYDGFPLVSRHWHKLRMFVKATTIYNYWKGLTSYHYAPGGMGEKRDRDAFEADGF